MNKIIITTTYRGYIIYPDGKKIDLKIIYRDDDCENLDESNITYDFLNKPVEHSEKKGFFYIPFYSRYLISKDGKLLDTIRNKFSKYTVSKKKEKDKRNRTQEYHKCVALNDINGKFYSARHRLISLAFHKYEMDPDFLVVNHKDGIPGNDFIDNLEWCTKRDNLIHALENGLMPNSTRKILAKNYLTNKEYSFNSIAEACIFFKFTHSKISHRLRRPIERYPDNIAFKIDDGLPWIDLPKVKQGMGIRVPIVAVNIIENKAYIFDTIMSAQRFTNVNTTTIAERIKFKSKKPSKNYYFITLEEFNVKPL